MNGYRFAYRVGFTPWEGYARATTASTGAKLDREETERARPLGRALDLGWAAACTPVSSRRGVACSQHRDAEQSGRK